VNIFSDSCGAVIIGRSEGETGILNKPLANIGPREKS
jgi:3-oxoacyl-[acyl-carrier-protein] synthase III